VHDEVAFRNKSCLPIEYQGLTNPEGGATVLSTASNTVELEYRGYQARTKSGKIC
jgi:hypothetical protein